MKTPILKMAYLCILMLTGIVCKAQYEWWPIHPGQVNYYKLDTGLSSISNNQIFSIYITDSIQVDSSSYYFFNTYLLKNTDDKNFNCEYGIKSTPLGRYLEVTETDFILKSDLGMSIKLSKHEVPGDTIHLSSTSDTSTNYSLVYIGQDVRNVFGEIDSIRRYYVLTIPKKNHYDSLILSKHYGLIKTPQIRLFDYIYTHHLNNYYDWDLSGTLTLAGNNALANNPVSTINFKDLFDYSEGDVIQIEEIREETYGNFWLPVDSTILNKKVIVQNILSKEITTDSIIYMIKIKTYHTYEFKSRQDWKFWDTVSVDTQRLTIAIARNSIDTPPGSVFNLDFSKATVAYTTKYNKNAIELIRYSGLVGFDTCLDILSHSRPSNNLFYGKNVGGPYYKEYSENSQFGSILSIERNLTYYSNSIGTWGTPYPFPLGLNKNTGDKASFIKIYPNPANELFTIDSNKEKAITITDVTGKIVYENEKAKAITAIVCKDWPTGVYIVKCFSDSHYEINKIIIQH